MTKEEARVKKLKNGKAASKDMTTGEMIKDRGSELVIDWV